MDPRVPVSEDSLEVRLEAPTDEIVSPDEAEPGGAHMPLLEHLQELRRRLRNAAAVFIVALIAGSFLVYRFFQVLVAPLVRGIERAGFEPSLQATGPTDGFWVSMKLALVLALASAGPFMAWELWKFLAPGLYRKERRMALLVAGGTAVCFVGGALFGHQVMAEPTGYVLTKMLAAFASAQLKVRPEYNIDEIANFLMLTLMGCGAAFELPVVLVLLGALGLVTARGLWRFNKYALVLSAVVGAVLTPGTDPLGQALLAGPLFVLYNLSIVIIWFIERGRGRAIDV